MGGREKLESPSQIARAAKALGTLNDHPHSCSLSSRPSPPRFVPPPSTARLSRSTTHRCALVRRRTRRVWTGTPSRATCSTSSRALGPSGRRTTAPTLPFLCASLGTIVAATASPMGAAAPRAAGSASTLSALGRTTPIWIRRGTCSPRSSSSTAPRCPGATCSSSLAPSRSRRWAGPSSAFAAAGSMTRTAPTPSRSALRPSSDPSTRAPSTATARRRSARLPWAKLRA
mmetsp:Transcript_43236/g.141953  ORF Transcript_43236/g.141953 Transcript_43236/m.141953 type:complete len:230 (+) Transcript_43236:3-692(+)